MKKKPAKMPKHGKAFARAYLDNDRNQTAAAMTLPGVTTRESAETIGSRLFGNVKVKAEIERLEKKLEDTFLIAKEWLLKEWLRDAKSDPSEVMKWNESGIDMIPSDKLTKEQRKLIKTLSHTTTATGESFKVEMVDRAEAKKEISKLLGYYPKEKIEVDHNVRVSVIDYSKAIKEPHEKS